MVFKQQGKIKSVSGIESVKSGKIKEKLTLVLEESGKEIIFILFDEKINLLKPLELGDEVIIHFSIKRAGTGSTNSCFCLNIEKVENKWSYSAGNSEPFGREAFEEFARRAGYQAGGFQDETKKRRGAPRGKWFSDCMSVDQAKSKYKRLVKQYHPDSPGGNNTIMSEINTEFTKNWK